MLSASNIRYEFAARTRALSAGGIGLIHGLVKALWLRNNEVYLDALGARRIPDPTRAGDSCRRFDHWKTFLLQEVINETRLLVWRQQPEEFLRRPSSTLTARSSRPAANARRVWTSTTKQSGVIIR
jgi:hypothetical protein